MSFTVFLGNLPIWVTADDIKSWLTAEDLSLRASDYQGLIEGLRDGHIDPMTRIARGYSLPLAFTALRPQKKRHAT